MIKKQEGIKKVSKEDLQKFNFVKKLKENQDIKKFIESMKHNKNSLFNLGSFLKGINVSNVVSAQAFLKDCVHVDLDVPLGSLKEGVVNGRFNYSSNVDFKPEFIDFIK